MERYELGGGAGDIGRSWFNGPPVRGRARVLPGGIDPSGAGPRDRPGRKARARGGTGQALGRGSPGAQPPPETVDRRGTPVGPRPRGGVGPRRGGAEVRGGLRTAGGGRGGGRRELDGPAGLPRPLRSADPLEVAPTACPGAGRVGGTRSRGVRTTTARSFAGVGRTVDGGVRSRAVQRAFSPPFRIFTGAFAPVFTEADPVEPAARAVASGSRARHARGVGGALFVCRFAREVTHGAAPKISTRGPLPHGPRRPCVRWTRSYRADAVIDPVDGR
jgi:hypothetical protein